MAQRIDILSITVPAGTLRTAPQSTNLRFRQGFLEKLELRIPPGPSGFVGVRILHSGRVVIPYEMDDWLITDDEIIAWPLESYPTGEAWSVNAFNEGIYEHTIQLRMLFGELGAQQVVTVPRIAITALLESAGARLEGADV